jgi:hypothetical protein
VDYSSRGRRQEVHTGLIWSHKSIIEPANARRKRVSGPLRPAGSLAKKRASERLLLATVIGLHIDGNAPRLA